MVAIGSLAVPRVGGNRRKAVSFSSVYQSTLCVLNVIPRVYNLIHAQLPERPFCAVSELQELAVLPRLLAVHTLAEPKL